MASTTQPQPLLVTSQQAWPYQHKYFNNQGMSAARLQELFDIPRYDDSGVIGYSEVKNGSYRELSINTIGVLGLK